jgi:hypothetical protein
MLLTPTPHFLCLHEANTLTIPLAAWAFDASCSLLFMWDLGNHVSPLASAFQLEIEICILDSPSHVDHPRYTLGNIEFITYPAHREAEDRLTLFLAYF